ncbi:Beta-phosphoglucomutase glucose-1-phosphate phosphodismutase [Limosilactobacillus equigenerosi DSM 18793 = JCM 14505]|uniref:Beta-phosphoglucomutase n=2 Tax=Limosilactobacillus TaxID=2742598 RepID=A0A0R1V128_9LACO|nr:Beta-phosphoglucomutase glucose-1-phosphate phosphodismutase [Limosilactobacillus equigenerosi DSM 18793 = JCM 14505]
MNKMSFAEIKAFAFDLDGVIADTARFHGQAWHQLADQVGTEWTPELADGLKGVGRMDSLEMILKAGGHENDYTLAEKEALATQKNDNYLRLVETLTPADILPGMQAFLDELKAQGYRLILASASKNAPKVLGYLKLSEYFEDIVDPAKLAHSKPAPDIYLQAAKQLGLQPNQVIGVEDAQAGIQAIKAAGELAIGIGDNLTDADVTFATTAEVSLAAIASQLS